MGFNKWSKELVIEYYDSHLNITLHELSALSGHTRAELKQILMGSS